MDASPMVARPGQKVHLRYRMLGNVDYGRIIPPNNAPVVPLTDDGNGVFSVDVTAPTPGVRDAFSPILGEVRGYISSDEKCFNNSFVHVITNEVPPARIVKLAGDAQRSDYVVNISMPSNVLPDLNALNFSFNAIPVAQRFYQLFGDDYDMLSFVLPGFYENRYHVVVKNSDQGIAIPVMDNSKSFGSSGRLMGYSVFPLFPYFDGAERGNTHELGHQWAAFLPKIPFAVPPHWPPSSMAIGIMGFGHATGTQGQEFPCLISKKNGVVTAANAGLAQFTDMDLYLMGLIPASQVGEHYVVTDINLANQMPDTCAFTLSPNQYATLTVQDVIRDYGARVPAVNPLKQIRIATILVTRDNLADADTMALADFLARRFQEKTNVPTKVGLVRRLGETMYTGTGQRLSVATQLTNTTMPEIDVGGVVNAANFAGGALLAPGTVLSMFGANLAGTTATAQTVPLQTTLGGVQVLVNGVPAPLFYVSPRQINFQLPWGLNTAQESYADEAGVTFLPAYTVRVQNGDVSSNLAYIYGQKDNPQIMVYGNNLAVAQDTNYAVIGSGNPAIPGKTIMVYLLGVSSLNGSVVTGAPAPLDTFIRFSGQTTATIGNSNAPVSFAGLTPGGVGLQQVNMTVPNLPPGAYNMRVSVNGFLSNTVTVNVGSQ